MRGCKRKAISLEQKAAILEAVSKGEKKRDVAARFAISQSTLSTILKAKDVILSSAKCGRSTSADAPEAATWLEKEMPKILTRYQPSEVYNADETGFFYQMLPNRTLALKGDRCHGGKQSKLHITALLCVNMDASDKRVRVKEGHGLLPEEIKE